MVSEQFHSPDSNEDLDQQKILTALMAPFIGSSMSSSSGAFEGMCDDGVLAFQELEFLFENSVIFQFTERQAIAGTLDSFVFSMEDGGMALRVEQVGYGSFVLRKSVIPDIQKVIRTAVNDK